MGKNKSKYTSSDVAVHARVDAMGNLQRKNLQKRIYDRDSATGNSVKGNKGEKNQMLIRIVVRLNK